MATLFPSYGSGGLPYSEMINKGSFDYSGAGAGGAGGGGGGMPLFGANQPGSNQYFNFNPAVTPMPGNTSSSGVPPGAVPPAGAPNLPSNNFPTGPGASASAGLPGGNTTIPTFDPNFTHQFYAWLQQQLGQGASPFNLSTPLPSGGSTQPGQLTAPLNPIEQSLMKFYQTGSADSGPMPGVMPMWNAALAAMNGPQGPAATEEARIRGQFAFGGNLASSPFAQAMTQFGEQNVLNENALLTSATQSALPGMQQFGSDIQQMDQGAINNMLQEFIRTRPEYSPLLNMLFGGATSSPGVVKKGSGAGALGGILGGAGTLLSGGAAVADAGGLGAVLAGI